MAPFLLRLGLYGILALVVGGFVIINNRLPALPPEHAHVVPGVTRVRELDALYHHGLSRADGCMASYRTWVGQGPWPSLRIVWIDYEFRGPNTHYPTGTKVDDGEAIITRITIEENTALPRYGTSW